MGRPLTELGYFLPPLRPLRDFLRLPPRPLRPSLKGNSPFSSSGCSFMFDLAYVAKLFVHGLCGGFEIVKERFLGSVTRVLADGFVDPEGFGKVAVNGVLS